MRRAADRVLGSELGRNTLWMLGGQMARTLVQAAYFVFLARSLRSDGYGAFVGAMALVMVAAPFVSLGSGFILIKHVSRDPTSFARQWGNCLFLIASSGVVLLAVTVVAANLILPASIPLALVAVLACAELFLARVIETAGHAFIAFRLLKWTSALQLSLSVFRLIAIVVMATLVRVPSPLEWGIAYLASTGLVTVFALVLVRSKLGKADLNIQRDQLELAEGFYFSISLSAQTFYNDIDKSLLSRISGLTASGIYGAAYRIVDVAFAPISAVISASYSRFFQAGEKGLREALSVTRRLMPWACLYAIIAASALVLGAGLLPWILGDSYEDTTEALRWLAPILVLRSIHYFLADAMSGAGHQRARSLVQVTVAVVNAVLNLALLPLYSWRGAAWASLATDALLCIGLFVVVRYVTRAETTS